MSRKRDDKRKAYCAGKRADGRPCRLTPLPGTARCWHHTYRVPGRPSKLTSDLSDRIVDAVRMGAYYDVAAEAVGIPRETLHRWMRRGDDVIAQALEHVDDIDNLGDNGIYDLIDPIEWPYVDFRHAVAGASAIAELELLELIRTAHPGWQAHMEILARRHPARWGRRMEVKHEGAVDVGKPRVVEPDEAAKRTAIAGILAGTGILDDDDEDENTTNNQEDQDR